MLLYFAALIFGLSLLIFSPNKFIKHSALIEKKRYVSSIIIGFTLVALGTSALEMVTSIIASLENAPELAVGNVLNSNIANVALVFAVTLLVSVIPVQKGSFTKEVSTFLSTTLLAGLVMIDSGLDIMNGVILIFVFFVDLFLLLGHCKALQDNLTQERPKDETSNISRSIVIGLTV